METLIGTISIITLAFMILVAKLLENEITEHKETINKQRDLIQEQQDEIEYLNFIIDLKKNGKVTQVPFWITERFIKENPNSIDFQYNGVQAYWVSERPRKIKLKI